MSLKQTWIMEGKKINKTLQTSSSGDGGLCICIWTLLGMGGAEGSLPRGMGGRLLPIGGNLFIGGGGLLVKNNK